MAEWIDYRALNNSARQYQNSETGAIISRRNFDNLRRASGMTLLSGLQGKQREKQVEQRQQKQQKVEQRKAAKQPALDYEQGKALEHIIRASKQQKIEIELMWDGPGHKTGLIRHRSAKFEAYRLLLVADLDSGMTASAAVMHQYGGDVPVFGHLIITVNGKQYYFDEYYRAQMGGY